MENKFKSGDTVRLKSGSPRMTINSYDYRKGGGMVICDWFYENMPNTKTFQENQLELDADTDGGKL